MMKLVAAFAFASLLASPALADPACNRLAVALVIDRSGSMMGQPMDNAKLGAVAAVDRLNASDCVTVIAFDSQPAVIVPLHALNDAANVKTAIAGLQALATTMNNEHMTLSTIGLGSSTDEQTRCMLSTTASGRFYKVVDATMLARLLARNRPGARSLISKHNDACDSSRASSLRLLPARQSRRAFKMHPSTKLRSRTRPRRMRT
jgi:hypothetical protein